MTAHLALTAEQRTAALSRQLGELYGLSCVPLWGTPRNLARKTYGGRIAKVSSAFGTPFMPWQRYVSDVAGEVRPETGLLAYRTVIILVPRQSGKTTLIRGKKTWRSRAWPRQTLMYAAQTRLAARRKWERDHVAAIEACKPLRGKFTVRRANGDEAIIWDNGSWWGITSNTETAGHGDVLDDADVDEAFAQVDDRLDAAFGPAMITRPQPQQWIVSTAGTLRSVYLNAKRQMGREIVESGLDSEIAMFDWTVPPGYDRTDPETWWSCMPALGHTVTEAAVAAELAKMDPAEFDRAYLNVTRLDEIQDDPNVPTDVWPDLVDLDSQVDSDLSVAFDVTPSRDRAAVGVFGPRADGLGHVEIIDDRPGTDWVVERLVELRDRYHPLSFGVDVAGPAGSLLVDLERAGFTRPTDPSKPERGQLAIPSAREAAAACGAFVDACRQDQLRQIDQDVLNTAIDGARTRPLGEAWAWARKYSSANISPLVAVTVARWAYMTREHLLVEETPPPASAPSSIDAGTDLFRPRSRLDL